MSKQEYELGGEKVAFEMTPDGPVVTIAGQQVNLDMKGQIRGFDAFGTKMEAVEGGQLVTRENGFQIKLLDGGGFEPVSPIKSIGIQDLADVADYAVTTEGGIATHRITFHGGGEAEIKVKLGQPGAYDLSSLHVEQRITNEGELYLMARKPERPAGE
ncbi:hypothetical protein [Pseudomonas putida]|uniref:hypothetical protein n=1 Tax=Pseudomonas putida TaxID=303 RepID=UPI0018D791ED|nr:hypothetical protein [Pseudomonas putida]MBH3471344.1 hypothetical protein [Pseudomonas putida]